MEGSLTCGGNGVDEGLKIRCDGNHHSTSNHGHQDIDIAPQIEPVRTGEEETMFEEKRVPYDSNVDQNCIGFDSKGENFDSGDIFGDDLRPPSFQEVFDVSTGPAVGDVPSHRPGCVPGLYTEESEDTFSRYSPTTATEKVHEFSKKVQNIESLIGALDTMVDNMYPIVQNALEYASGSYRAFQACKEHMAKVDLAAKMAKMVFVDFGLNDLNPPWPLVDGDTGDTSRGESGVGGAPDDGETGLDGQVTGQCYDPIEEEGGSAKQHELHRTDEKRRGSEKDGYCCAYIQPAEWTLSQRWDILHAMGFGEKDAAILAYSSKFGELDPSMAGSSRCGESHANNSSSDCDREGFDYYTESDSEQLVLVPIHTDPNTPNTAEPRERSEDHQSASDDDEWEDCDDDETSSERIEAQEYLHRYNRLIDAELQDQGTDNCPSSPEASTPPDSVPSSSPLTPRSDDCSDADIISTRMPLLPPPKSDSPLRNSSKERPCSPPLSLSVSQKQLDWITEAIGEHEPADRNGISPTHDKQSHPPPRSLSPLMSEEEIKRVQITQSPKQSFVLTKQN